MKLSIVIPLYNEEKIIDVLFNRIINAAKEITNDFEVICVDDGSSDNTLNFLIEKHRVDSRFKVLTLSKNFGHQAAYTAGLSHAKGEYIAMLDGDLQDPPEYLKEMFEKLTSEQYDIIYGRRIERNEKASKKLSIMLFHLIFNKLSNINAPTNVGNFSMMGRNVLEAFLQLNEKNRYLPGLRYYVGFRQGFIDYKRPDREHGEAKMNFSRLFKLALDAIFSFSNIPIKICLYLGLTGIFFSLIGATIVFIKKINGDAITGWTSILLSIYFFGSIQLIFLGILGEYIFRTYTETQNRPIFIVREFYG